MEDPAQSVQSVFGSLEKDAVLICIHSWICFSMDYHYFIILLKMPQWLHKQLLFFYLSF